MASFGRSEGRVTIAKLFGADVIIRTTDVDKTIVHLKDIAERMNNLEPVFDRFGQYMVREHIPMQFERKGTPRRWAPLSPAYARWKQRHYPGRPLLVLSGKMRRLFKYRAGPRSLRIDNRRRAGNARLFDIHQFGASRAPARPMIQVTETDRDVFREMVREHVAGES